ncbi:MAG: zinc ribbon domain-containing protein [Solirubrobacteraceae bacterium]
MEATFPPVPQPPMNSAEQPNAVIVDNRTELADQAVLHAVRDTWVETAGLQFGHPTSFQLYGVNQGSMLARTPFKTPSSVMEEIKLARSVADTDDDIGGIIGGMSAVAFGDGLQNQHRDEQTLEFFNVMTSPVNMDLETVMEEMYREFLIAASVTTVTIFSRQRIQYWPLKKGAGEQSVQAQLQVPTVGILPAENIRVITNDLVRQGQLAYYCEDEGLKNWLDEYLSPRTSAGRRVLMAGQEPIAAVLFTGRVQMPYTDGDRESRGLTLYTLNPRMVHRSTAPKGAMPYARPFLTRNFALLEAKRLLNVMDYALLQGGTNYIVVAKKGSDNLPAQQPEVDNLMEQVRHASRSGVMVGDHRLTIEIITPKLDELLNPAKRKLVGRKLKMGLMRQTEEVGNDSGTQGAMNEMEMTGRVVGADRRKLIRHAQATFYDETATRNRSTFPQGAPNIWAPKLVLANIGLFWTNLLQARDRGDIPRRWVVEALGYDYDAALAERERELARGDDEILMPGAVPFSDPGQPQDNNPGRPVGASSNNGRSRDTPTPAGPPRRVLHRTAGDTTVSAMVDGSDVHFVGEQTAALLEEYAETADFGAHITQVERDAIELNQTLRQASSVVVPVNPGVRCDDYACVKLDTGLRAIIGRRVGDRAFMARALRFTEPHFNLTEAAQYAIRWGFLAEPLIEGDEEARRKKPSSATLGGYGTTCWNCGASLQSSGPVCANCGADNTGGGKIGGDMAALMSQLIELAKGGIAPGKYTYLKCPECGLIQDAAHTHCSRCGHDLTQARKGMFANLAGKQPTLHSKPPPPASDQPDLRRKS